MPYKNKIRGVYIIQSERYNKRFYVGSSWDILWRWTKHLSDLRKNTHHSIKLQNHFNKYGEDDLIFEIIEGGEYLCKQHLFAREQGWYELFKMSNLELPYFNIAKIAGSNRGISRRKNTKMKMSTHMQGRIPWNKGMRYSTIKSENKNKKKRKLVFIIDGKRHHAPESIEKMRIIKNHQSEETRRRNSESQKLRWQKWREERGREMTPYYFNKVYKK